MILISLTSHQHEALPSQQIKALITPTLHHSHQLIVMTN